MSIYTTPLQFGYFLGLSMAILLWYRGWKEERLSDILLGWVMFFLSMEIQDYTFGFAGINYLWNEMNGFPRGTALLFGPAIYFYLRAQINKNFKLHRGHLKHLLAWFIPFAIEFIIFLLGKESVDAWQNSVFRSSISWPRTFLVWGSYIFYFYKSLQLYQTYRSWAINQYSNQDVISYHWFRNLIYFMIIGILFKESMGLVDTFFQLDFYQDWWWNLAMVAIIFYVGIWGYSQQQTYGPAYEKTDSEEPTNIEAQQMPEVDEWREKIENHMRSQKPFLDPQLNLRTLSGQLNTNTSILSAAINRCFGKNFNDLINEYRIEEFLLKSKDESLAHYTLLSLALDSGFNSKSTFNRAFKKATGKTPNEINR